MKLNSTTKCISLLIYLLILSNVLRAQKDYPKQQFVCKATDTIPISITYREDLTTFTLKIGNLPPVSENSPDQLTARTFLFKRIKKSLNNICMDASPAKIDVEAERIAMEAVNHYLQSEILQIDVIKISDNKELRLYSDRGKFTLSVVNIVNHATSDVLEKETKGYGFMVPRLKEEKLVIEKMLAMLEKRKDLIDIPEVFLLPTQKLFIRNPTGDDSTITLNANEVNLLKGKEVLAEKRLQPDKPMFYIKTGETVAETVIKAEALIELPKEEELIPALSITCCEDSSFTLVAFTYPKYDADSFKLVIHTVTKILKEKILSNQVIDAEFLNQVENELGVKCTHSDTKSNITLYSKNVKAAIAKRDDTNRERDIKIYYYGNSKNKPDSFSIRLIGGGDLQKSITNNTSLQGSTSIGLHYFRKTNQSTIWSSVELEANINVASTSDTLRGNLDNERKLINPRDFGNFLLTPVTSRQSARIFYTGYFNKNNLIGNFLDGITLHCNIANSVWSINDTSINVSCASYKFLLIHDLLIDGIRFNEGLSIFIAGGYTGRLIFGDIISSKKRDNRKRYLGIDKKMLHGVEIMFGFHFENLIIDFQIPYVITGDVPGLSHGQFITSIRFVGGVSIFNKKLFNRRVSPLKMVE